MKLLWFTWKDATHPLAGGAEVVNSQITKRLVADGHEIICIVGGYPHALAEETVNGCRIIRVGNRYSVYWRAYQYYRKHLSGWPDIVVDEVNTMPFFAKFFARQPNILLVHQLCRQIWFYQLPLPFSFIGYLAEPLYLWLVRDRNVVTISDSTKQDMLRYGFNEQKIHVISQGIELKPITSLDNSTKFSQPTLLSLGSLRAMKRTMDQIKAFEIAKDSIPDLQLKVAGDANDRYGQKVLAYIKQSRYAADIAYLGKVSSDDRKQLMQRSHLIMASSVKEGWGLIVTEAASQGTPAVVYDVDGLRDSVVDKKTGVVVSPNTPKALGERVVEVLQNPGLYAALQQQAWQLSKQHTFDKAYSDFKATLAAALPDLAYQMTRRTGALPSANAETE